jgi:hypothetical protein
LSTGAADRRPSQSTPKTFDVVAVVLRRHDQLASVRREADLARCARELRHLGRVEAQRARGSRDREEPAEGDVVALEAAAAERVEHVEQIAVGSDADREGAAGADHLSQIELRAAHSEDRNRVATGVDGKQQVAVAVVDERVLRRQMVNHGAGELAADAAGAVDTRLGERPARRTVVGDDRVGGQVVALHEHRAAAEVEVGVVAERRRRRAAGAERQRHDGDRAGRGEFPVAVVHLGLLGGFDASNAESAPAQRRYTRRPAAA